MQDGTRFLVSSSFSSLALATAVDADAAVAAAASSSSFPRFHSPGATQMQFCLT